VRILIIEHAKIKLAFAGMRIVLCLICLALPMFAETLAAVEQKKAAGNPPPTADSKPDSVIRLWPGDCPNLVAGGKPEAIVNDRYVNVSVPQLLVYLPSREKANGTALIVCPGGGYSHLNTRTSVDNVVRLLNDQGIAVFGLKYRTRYGNNDVVEDALADGKRAVRIVRTRAREWGIDPQRIGVQGYSAGGNLCLNLAGRFDDGDPAATDPTERSGSRPDFVVLMCPWPNKRTVKDFPLSKRSPPTFIASARDDKTAPFGFATAIDEKFKELGITEQLFVVETGGHGAFQFGVAQSPGAKWPEALLPWLRQIGMLRAAAARPRRSP
jgi:acetyl esterase/lipase